MNDLFNGRLERDLGMGKAFSRDPTWNTEALKIILDLPIGWEGTGQQIRIMVVNQIGEPHHFNVWGALINEAIMKRLLVRTGRQAHARIRASHARRNDVYRRTP
jgi:hypothetical protein